ncbi:hypothetical protein JCM8208_005597 [Rhodotorula glutinis]
MPATPPAPDDHSDDDVDVLRAKLQDSQAAVRELKRQRKADRLEIERAAAGKKARKSRAIQLDDASPAENDERKRIHRATGRVVIMHNLFFAGGNGVWRVEIHSGVAAKYRLQVQYLPSDSEDPDAPDEPMPWATWTDEPEYLEAHRPYDYKDLPARVKKNRDNTILKEFKLAVRRRREFEDLIGAIGLDSPLVPRLSVFHVQEQIAVFTTGVRTFLVDRINATAASIFGKKVDRDDEEQCLDLLEDNAFTFSHVGASSSDLKYSKNKVDVREKMFGGPMTRALQSIHFGPNAIGQEPPYPSGKEPFAKLHGLTNVTPTMLAAVATTLYAALDHVSFDAPLAVAKPKKQRRKGKSKSLLIFSDSRYGALYRKFRTDYEKFGETKAGLAVLARVDRAVFPQYEDEDEDGAGVVDERAQERSNDLSAALDDTDDEDEAQDGTASGDGPDA